MTPTSINYDVINRGAYKVNHVLRTPATVYEFGQSVLFQPGVSTHEDFTTYNYAAGGITLPHEALRGTDPNRRSYGHSFDENHIASIYLFDEFVFNLQAAEHRVEGETDLTKPWSVDQRLIYLVAKAREEWQLGQKIVVEKAVWDAILTGKFSTLNGGDQVFPLSDDLLGLSGANLYTKPIETIVDACTAILNKGGAMPTSIVFNPGDWTRLIGTDKFTKLLDNRRILDNEVGSDAANVNGLARVGYINVPGFGTLTAYTYIGSYDDDGDRTYFLPQGSALLHNGAIGRLDHCGVYVNNGMVQEKVGVDVYAHLYKRDRGVLVDTMIQMQSAPCPVVTAIDRYGVITGIPASA